MPDKSLVIEQSFFVKAPVREVFRALSDPSELARWFLKSARLPPKKGEDYEFVWQGGHRHEGQVLEFLPNRRLSLSWPNRYRNATLWTKVTFTVSKEGRGTRLRLRHAGYPRSGGWVEVYGDTQSGWAYFLLNLRSVLERGHDLRSAKDT
jgi:uncharacterized protein YndB with AHSA1/START domain